MTFDVWRSPRTRVTVTIASVLGVLLPLLAAATPAAAATNDVGYQDVAYTGAGDAPTADKPQSKLWFNDGSWWADMFDTVSRTWHIFRLDRTAESWVDTGTRIDDRPNSRGDTLWDGTHLYVASNVLAASSTANAAGQPARLYRYTYDTSTRAYRLDTGFPANINNYSSESLTFDKDSRGVLWATWTQGQQVYVNSTTGSDTAWGTPSVLPMPGATGLNGDDISALAAFGRTRVGLMWSNQATSTFYFATHKDGDSSNTWTSQVALSNPHVADDHINLKQLEADDLGHVYAAVKTSNDDLPDSTLPQIELLALNPNSGKWDASVFGTIADCHTRPQIVIDSVNRVLHVFATAPSSGGCPYAGSPGSIYEKTTSLNDLSFPAGRGTPVIQDGASANMNNVTTTKQNVTPAMGLVVLASNDVTRRYWHADIPLTRAKPNVSFTATPTSGTAPLAVQFTDTSTGGLSAWSWTFGDGGTSTAQNPTHTFTTAGTYTVTLTGTTANGGTATSTASIQVTAPVTAGTVTFGSATSTGQSTAVNSVTLTKPAGTSAGDVLVASFTADNGPSATPPAGWTSFLPSLRPGGASLFGYYHVVTASDTTSTSWTWTLSSAQKWSGGISRFLGVNTTTPLDAPVTSASTSNSVSSITVPAVTTATTGAMLVGGSGGDTATVTPRRPPASRSPGRTGPARWPSRPTWPLPAPVPKAARPGPSVLLAP